MICLKIIQNPERNCEALTQYYDMSYCQAEETSKTMTQYYDNRHDRATDFQVIATDRATTFWYRSEYFEDRFTTAAS